MKGECKCARPVRHTNPNKRTECVKCGRTISPAWSPTEETLLAFFALAAEGSMPTSPHDKPPMWQEPHWWEAFRAHCRRRELVGRDYFAFAYLDRQNSDEIKEELADTAIYAYLEALKRIRAGGEARQSRLLEIALKAGELYKLVLDDQAEES